MSQPTPPRPLDVRGAVDLSALTRPAAPPPDSPYVVDVDEAGFGDVVQTSTRVPVVVLLWATWSEASTTLAADLAALADEDGGRWLLARVDAEANPQIAAAFQAQSVPTVVAVVNGQPVPLFAGAYPREQVRAVLDQLLTAAAQAGVTGGAGAADGDAGPEGAPAEPPEPPLPPLHQAAYDAIERDDLPAAEQAYRDALRENPRDDLARAGLAQVGLLARTRSMDPAAVRQAAADGPRDLVAQLDTADLDLATGHVEDAFSRLLDLVRGSGGAEREQARQRLVDLFEVVGGDDPRVLAARRGLASALY